MLFEKYNNCKCKLNKINNNSQLFNIKNFGKIFMYFGIWVFLRTYIIIYVLIYQHSVLICM